MILINFLRENCNPRKGGVCRACNMRHARAEHLWILIKVTFDIDNSFLVLKLRNNFPEILPAMNFDFTVAATPFSGKRIFLSSRHSFSENTLQSWSSHYFINWYFKGSVQVKQYFRHLHRHSLLLRKKFCLSRDSCVCLHHFSPPWRSAAIKATGKCVTSDSFICPPKQCDTQTGTKRLFEHTR